MNESRTPPYGARGGRCAWPATLALAAGLWATTAAAQIDFPSIPMWAEPGVRVTVGTDTSSLIPKSRSITVRWKRDRVAEARADFGGYRLYRMTSSPDTSRAVLLRRYSLQQGDEIMWHFSKVDPVDLEFKFGPTVAGDSIVQFVDPDSAGNFVKVCRRVDQFDRCLSIGDSVWKLITPPGPHDGYNYYYSITYEGRNTLDNNYEDLFDPDTLDAPGLTQPERYARCDTVGRPSTCPNKNTKSRNMLQIPVNPTAGPTSNLERVAVVPNPFRQREPWDPTGGNEVHFTNLPSRATIRIYTVAGDLVRVIEHNDTVRDFARWDLKNGDGSDVASGVYIFRIEAGTLSIQNRMVVVR
jgi:hypothetical protein